MSSLAQRSGHAARTLEQTKHQRPTPQSAARVVLVDGGVKAGREQLEILLISIETEGFALGGKGS